jgi:hypothetical protein
MFDMVFDSGKLYIRKRHLYTGHAEYVVLPFKDLIKVAPLSEMFAYYKGFSL